MSRNAVAAFAVLVAVGFAGCAATARGETTRGHAHQHYSAQAPHAVQTAR